jgi:RNA polymerase sigma-70 factor (ECF subfamily)
MEVEMVARGAALDGKEGWASALPDDDPRDGMPLERADEARFRAIRDGYFEFVWRSVRRLGVPEADVDDAVQQVFIVVARRLGAIQPGSERAFLFATALRVASHARRTAQRRGEVQELPELGDGAPSAEELMDRQRARELLDRVLAALPIDVRAVFILFELEEMTQAEIAGLLDLPQGTVASRLRRAREEFQAEVARMKARWEGPARPAQRRVP